MEDAGGECRDMSDLVFRPKHAILTPRYLLMALRYERGLELRRLLRAIGGLPTCMGPRCLRRIYDIGMASTYSRFIKDADAPYRLTF